MKVNNYGNIQGIMKAYASRKKEDAGKGINHQESGGGDTLELSVQAREMREIKASLKDINDIRPEKVAKIKSEIASGAYRIDAGKIAEGMAEERLLDKQV